MHAAAIAALAAAALCLPCLSPAEATTPGQNGKVVFTSGRDLNYEVYSSNTDGSNAVNLSGNPAADMFPSVAPGGAKIAFTSFRDASDAEIYVMNADGSDQTRLTTQSGTDSRPTWSPDGQRIAFRSDRDGDWEIYVMNADGSDQTNVTNSPGVDDAPAWSPDGGRIGFETLRDGNREVYVMGADGSAQTNLTANPAQDFEPSWSPDGQRIAFASDRDGNDEIYTMAAGGALQTRLTDNSSTDTDPAWSPDATKIVFRSTRDGNSEVYSMGSGGTAQTRLTTVTQFDGHPDWQSLVSGFARPKGASPFRASLVPAYQPCVVATREHGPPLAFPSCNPPVQESSYLTVGTPDANGPPANSVGSLRYGVQAGVPGPPDDSDVNIAFSYSDVRCRIGISTCAGGSLSDYTGEVEVSTDMRISDRNNAVAPDGGSESGTVNDLPFTFTVPCVATLTSDGGRCTMYTTANALSPGFARDTKRTLIELSNVRVMDGGSDGQVATPPNGLFAVQGIFVP
jgi:Tol biopolymer transport system component